MKPLVRKLNKNIISKKGMGAILAQAIPPIFKNTIIELREPPNAPLTIAIKGSDNPLVDTGLMGTTLLGVVREMKRR